MFYSHEVLTQNKYGIATVWLMATLGPNASYKKIGKKAILRVDIGKACETVTAPAAPMALRLQSNLLFGISKVYSQQCGFVLADAQATHVAMKAFLKASSAITLDPHAGKARQDQLILQDDPAFVPGSLAPFDFDLGGLFHSDASLPPVPDLVNDDGSSSRRSSMSHENVALMVPSSDNSLQLPSLHTLNLQDNASDNVRVSIQNYAGFNPDIDFNFDDDGMIVGLNDDVVEAGHVLSNDLVAPHSVSPTGLPLYSSSSGGHHLNSLPANQPDPDAMLVDDAYIPVDEANPNAQTSRLSTPSESSQEMMSQRKARSRKVLPLDDDHMKEVSSSDIKAWHQNYIANMRQAALAKDVARSISAAKTTSIGFFNVSPGMDPRNPLSIFDGTNLLQLFKEDTGALSRKRTGTEAGFEDGSPRLRAGDDGEMPQNADDDLGLHDMDDIEVGRHEMSELLDERSSQMPWNILSSTHGSRAGSWGPSRQGSVARRGKPGSALSSVGMPGSGLNIRSSVSGRPNAAAIENSPLFNRGRSSIDGPSSSDQLQLPDDLLELADEDVQLGEPLIEPTTQNTHRSEHSQWLQDTLGRERNNFLDFLRLEIESKTNLQTQTSQPGEASQSSRPPNSMTFAELLEPGKHSKQVAAQAFHHVLSLGTQGLVRLEQAGQFDASILIELLV